MGPNDPAAAPSDDAFFDAPDTIPSPPPPPPPPYAPSASTLRRRRPRGAKILKEPDEIPSPLASAAYTVTAADEPVKVEPGDSSAPTATAADEPVKVEPGDSSVSVSTVTATDELVKVEPGDSSEATSAPHPPSPPPEEEVVVDKDAVVDAGDRGHTPTPTPPTPTPTPTPPPPPPPGILEFLAVLIVRAVVFQVSALISCLTFPVRLVQWWFLFVTDPVGFVRRARAWAVGAVEQATCAVTVLIGGGEEVGRLALRLAWGSLWAVYVCVLLCALLAMAFMGGGLLVGRIVEEPVQVTEALNFDYTKPSPVAFVPVRRLVPPNQRMQLEVFLTLPESDYNRRLGVFQVRADLLSAGGKVVSTSSQPCMLKFKSVHMHFVETFLQSVFLLSGYSSESQVIRLKMNGIMEALEPLTGVRIILEQRAEFSPGAGIPEIYAASLKLEAAFSLPKRIIWNWRWTIFVWSSMGLFVFELLFALVCCRPCIFPRSGHNAVAP